MKKMDMKGVDAALQANDRAAEVLAEREEEARARLAAIDGEYGAVRAERTAALAREEDPATMTERLRGLREERELLEDELPTLGTRKAELEAGRKDLLEQRETLRLQGLRGKLQHTVAAYNEAAHALGVAVTELRALQAEAKTPDIGKALGSPIVNWRICLTELCLPVLFATADGAARALPRIDNAASESWHLRSQVPPRPQGFLAALAANQTGGKR